LILVPPLDTLLYISKAGQNKKKKRTILHGYYIKNLRRCISTPG
jgi:hypothetical protein